MSSMCPVCANGCQTCSYTPNNCTSCTDYYKLDNEAKCYFRYTLQIVLVTAILLLVVLVMIRMLVNCFSANDKLKPPKKFKQPVLDAESRRNNFFVNDVKKIGLTENDNEISRVESKDPADGNWFINDRSIDDALSEGGLIPKAGFSKKERAGNRRGYESIR